MDTEKTDSHGFTRSHRSAWERSADVLRPALPRHRLNALGGEAVAHAPHVLDQVALAAQLAPQGFEVLWESRGLT